MEKNAKARIELLLARLRAAGEQEEAMLEFIRYYSPRFARFLRSRGFSEIDSDDLGSECATQALIRLEHFSGGPLAFEPWCYRVSHNYAEDWRRKRSGVRFEELKEDFPAQSDEEEEELRATQHELAKAVREKLEMLSPGEHAVIRLHHLDGSASFAEIGKELGISEVAARVRYHRAAAKLARLLQKDPRVRTRAM